MVYVKKLNSLFSPLCQSQILHPLILLFLFLTTENRDDPNQFSQDHLKLIASDELIIKMQSTLHL